MSGEGDRVALAQLSEKLKTIISHLYDLELTASDYPADAPPDLLHEQMYPRHDIRNHNESDTI